MLDELPLLGDVQCSWVVLGMSAVARSNHLARILPPTMSRGYTDGHDDAIWECFCNILGVGALHNDRLARQIATLPGRMGGLGVRSATRSATGAYWASWVSAFPIIRAKAPPIAQAILQELTSAQGPTTFALRELASARWQLTQEGAADLPPWQDVAKGVEPIPPDRHADAADFVQGWQCLACSYSETHFLEHVVLPSCNRSRRTLLLSQSGGASGAFLRAVPSETAMVMSAIRFQVAIRRRLRWPLPQLGGKCSLGRLGRSRGSMPAKRTPDATINPIRKNLGPDISGSRRQSPGQRVLTGHGPPRNRSSRQSTHRDGSI